MNRQNQASVLIQLTPARRRRIEYYAARAAARLPVAAHTLGRLIPMTIATKPYHLLYVQDWDADLQEPTGGRCLGSFDCLRDAVAAHDDYRRAAPRIWGDGHLVVTGPDHSPVHGSASIVLAAKGDR